jgi:acetate kinase
VKQKRDILVINTGSSSIKFALFADDLTEKLQGSAIEIGGASRFSIAGKKQDIDLPDHRAAMAQILTALKSVGVTPAGLRAAAHRIVHGGTQLTAPVALTARTLDEIGACSPLAPLHNPHQLTAIRALANLAPDLPQYASFDTAFHATNSAVARRYAIPDTVETKGIIRYGFHGLSYASLCHALPTISGAALPARVLAFHLGNGASICAIRDGKSVATTMGYSPLEGLTMGTRVGTIDANAALKLAEDHGIARARAILNNESGLIGLSGTTSDMRALIAEGSKESAFAIEHFIYWAVRHAGSMIAAMGGVDAMVFTGGIGEHAAPVRSGIADGLAWLGADIDETANGVAQARVHTNASKIGIWIVPAMEERQIAIDALTLMGDL